AHRQVLSDLGSVIMERADELSEIDKSRLFLVAMFVQITWQDLAFPLSAGVESFRPAYVTSCPSPSQLQRDVSATLEQMGWSHRVGYVTKEGFSLDLARPVSKVALEVVGPSRSLVCTETRERTPNGAMQFESRLLRSVGWTILHVPFYEWEGKALAERRELLMRKLARARA
ncbi:MAG: RAP domain-containing protein, partial [Planctomycetota bacterium]